MVCPFCPAPDERATLEVISRGAEGPRQMAPPLLFVHGAWHAAACWDEHFLPYFAELGFECHALSLRGHGRSGGAEGLKFYRISDYVSDVCSVARGLREPPIVVAHSIANGDGQVAAPAFGAGPRVGA